MIYLGHVQNLKVKKIVEFGVYLYDGENEEDSVLLPKKQLDEDLKIGDTIEVFIYRDSSDRLIATTKTDVLSVGKVTTLTVKQITKIGAFLDWGLEKDLLLPFKEQTYKIKESDKIPVALYVDKSDRLCATMKVYRFLLCNSNYKADDIVKGFVYEISEKFGAFVAIDDIYSALIPKKECTSEIKIGDRIEARVTRVLMDGRLNLSIREKAYLQIYKDIEVIYDMLVKNDGFLPFNDKTKPDIIKAKFSMSKNEFKRAIGRLYKERKIVFKGDGIELVHLR